jgi:hypothetical protein
MSEYSITDFRINGDRYYLVERENKVSFYTTNIAAARYWIRSEMNDPTLIRPFQGATPTIDATPDQPQDGTEVIAAGSKDEPEAKDSMPAESSDQNPEVPKKPVRIS